MSNLERIKNILSEQIRECRKLLEILQKERQRLVNLESSGVEALSKEKDTVVLKLRLLEEERVRLLSAFAGGSGMAADISLKGLYEKTGDGAFMDLRCQLISLVQSITELNEFNRILIERSLSAVSSSIGFFDSFGLDVHNGKGAVISREI
ncbi:MAG: flagellar protein FlgN [Nitrospiraceae bacterium]|nr:flagellar protein FlgN [Nitrospiraceae bacterium]